ncbi:MAG: NAD(P)-dependent oxidoreductase [Gammaproteobacteria bacterium]|nr:NAD(P)-dependent oxidoreductase [Gammaproteobacteria bacterium]
METVIVTGSSGFIGKAVIARLAGQYDLIGFDREQAPHPPPNAECICVDLTSEESIVAAFVVVGLILIAISLPRGGRSRHHYGSWDRFVV